MARERNFLLGNGERLTQLVDVPSGGGHKKPPYSVHQARARIGVQLQASTVDFDSLPAAARPDDEVVAALVLHPRYTSKSDQPAQLLAKVGLRTIGSKKRRIQPERWGLKKHPKDAETDVLFAAGKRAAFAHWSEEMARWDPSSKASQQLTHIELVEAFRAEDKLKNLPSTESGWFEVVLHNSGSPHVLAAFRRYAEDFDAEVLTARKRDVGGLTFVPARIDTESAVRLAAFSMVRVVRGMPSLRPVMPMLRTHSRFPISLPSEKAVDPSATITIFDGGLPAAHPLGQWVRSIEPPSIGPADQDYIAHGLAVTSSVLFGPLEDGVQPSRPLCRVEHVRVLDAATGASHDLEYLDVLDRILKHLDSNSTRYVNLSIGPDLPVSDDDVTEWTAALDARLADGGAVVTVAAGNEGTRDAASGLNRVQAPADGVNVFSLGATDHSNGTWARANYSCVGPGRCPGVVKPDAVAFGGSRAEPFGVLVSSSPVEGTGVSGTSFAAPFALRTIVGCGLQLGKSVGPLALRALMIHRADPGSHRRTDVGWGRIETDLSRLITCEDNEAIVIYQGNLPVNSHLRAAVPLPKNALMGMVDITATLVIAPEVDPEHAAAYTRSGLEVAFRPHGGKYRKKKKGPPPAHAKSTSFFSTRNLFRDGEYQLSDDAHKWEPCLRHSRSFRSTSLDKPCFDIYYHHRLAGARAPSPRPIPYCLVVGMRSKRVVDLYDQVIRDYASILIPLKPRIQIPIRT